jgi:hypothetical protein
MQQLVTVSNVNMDMDMDMDMDNPRSPSTTTPRRRASTGDRRLRVPPASDDSTTSLPSLPWTTLDYHLKPEGYLCLQLLRHVQIDNQLRTKLTSTSVVSDTPNLTIVIKPVVTDNQLGPNAADCLSHLFASRVYVLTPPRPFDSFIMHKYSLIADMQPRPSCISELASLISRLSPIRASSPPPRRSAGIVQ